MYTELVTTIYVLELYLFNLFDPFFELLQVHALWHVGYDAYVLCYDFLSLTVLLFHLFVPVLTELVRQIHHSQQLSVRYLRPTCLTQNLVYTTREPAPQLGLDLLCHVLLPIQQVVYPSVPFRILSCEHITQVYVELVRHLQVLRCDHTDLFQEILHFIRRNLS